LFVIFLVMCARLGWPYHTSHSLHHKHCHNSSVIADEQLISTTAASFTVNTILPSAHVETTNDSHYNTEEMQYQSTVQRAAYKHYLVQWTKKLIDTFIKLLLIRQRNNYYCADKDTHCAVVIIIYRCYCLQSLFHCPTFHPNKKNLC